MGIHSESDRLESDDHLVRIANFFDHHGDTWISVYEREAKERWWEYYPIRIRESYACNLIQAENKGVAVDLGCGTGHALLEMMQMGFARIIGIDISENMLESARNLIAKRNSGDRIELYRCDVQNLNMIKANSVDVCTALGVLEYLPDDEEFLFEVHRILKPGGVLVFQVRNGCCYKNKTVRLLRTLLPALKDGIWFREHIPSSLAETLRKQQFVIEERRFAHYYALYPFSYIPGVRLLVRFFDNALNKRLEAFLCEKDISVFLASMFIVKARKTRADI